jgi:hypothetical protein
MRRRIGIIALILALAFLAAVPAIRRADEKATLAANRRYEAALYFAHIRAIDSNTSRPIEFDLRWDTDEISPFFKGAGPTVEERLTDGTRILALVGVQRSSPFRIEVTAEGYQSNHIEIDPQSSGFLTQDSSRLLQTISLIPTLPVNEDSTDK